ncbi:MAG: hypothetical protein ETSY1_00745 [Candidatus Entotheonella factor]|uniref:HepT-like domain-containing protein n=1 Tax=Entotheonella factor TaxID=1429438 RepID=W4M0P0_ENTF1|nr:hypothetical protein [Candidatus Entotheonella palauensis]ETX03232.1 MAG: hypothetical protein ETSY1_00745 [Candidatus Entotheonella factor]
MDSGALIILRTEIEAQMTLIHALYQRLDERVADLHPEHQVLMESAAYQLHNLYSAIENLLQLMAAHFENHISDTARWHTALLQRMSVEIPGVRPAVVSSESYDLLNGLRGFRHFFRHAYGAEIEYAQLQLNLDKAQTLRPLFDADIARFIDALQDRASGA